MTRALLIALLVTPFPVFPAASFQVSFQESFDFGKFDIYSRELRERQRESLTGGKTQVDCSAVFQSPPSGAFCHVEGSAFSVGYPSSVTVSSYSGDPGTLEFEKHDQSGKEVVLGPDGFSPLSFPLSASSSPQTKNCFFVSHFDLASLFDAGSLGATFSSSFTLEAVFTAVQ